MSEHEVEGRRSIFWFALLALLLVSFANQFALLFTFSEEGFGMRFAFRPLPLGYGVRGKYIALCDLLIMFVFIIWLSSILASGRRRHVELRSLPHCLLSLLVIGLASAINSVWVWRALLDGLSQFGLSPKAFLFAEHFREAVTEFFQWTLYLLILPLVFLSLFKKLNGSLRAISLDLLLALVLLNELFAIYDYVVRQDPSAVAGLFGSRNIYTGFLALTLPLILSHALFGHSKLRVALALVAVAVGLFTSLSGWVWLALSVGICVTLFLHSRLSFALCIAYILLFLAFSCIFKTRFYTEAIPHIVNLYDDEGDVRKEYIEWQAALNCMSQDAPPPRSNFLFGVGIGGYQLNINDYYGSFPNKEKMPLDSNSLYLVIGTTLGFVGLATLISIMLHNGALALELYKDAGDDFSRAFGCGMLGCIVAFAVSSVFTNLLVRGTGPLLVALISMLHAIYWDSKRQGK
ncbi:MAG: hypothetical protein HZRFUVUK_000226 [Candidatus Fervidibacterota bacterium]